MKVLLWFVTLLMLFQAGWGLTHPELYHDNIFVLSAWRGNDAITLVLAVPFFIWTMFLFSRGSLRGSLFLSGMLAYNIYNYAFYLFGAKLNSHFLIYTLIFATSFYSLCWVIWNLKPKLDQISFESTVGFKVASVFMIICGVFLGVLWIAQSLQYAVKGVLPSIVVMTEHPTNVTAALDLSIMVPGFIIGGLNLLRARPLGYLLGFLMNVKGAIYTLVLAAGSWFAGQAGIPGVREQIPLWLFLTFGSVLSLFLLIKSSPKVSR